MQAAEQRGLMAFGQAWNMSSFAPKAQLTAIENHWGIYYVERIQRCSTASGSGRHLLGPEGGHGQDEPLRPKVTPEARRRGDATAAGIKDGSPPVFAGPIKDRDGTERVAAGATSTTPGCGRWTGTSKAFRADLSEGPASRRASTDQ